MHCTQAWVTVSHRRVSTPPSPVAVAQPMSLAQPTAHARVAGSQYRPAGQVSGAVLQPTHRPEAVSHTGPAALPAQSRSAMQRAGASLTSEPRSARASTPPSPPPTGALQPAANAASMASAAVPPRKLESIC
jgi:hypothetical protein